jgi:hypothetical protein
VSVGGRLTSESSAHTSNVTSHRPPREAGNGAVPRPLGNSGWTRICKAHRTDGQPCAAPAIRGGVVCRFHGGSTRHVREAARERLAALVDPAITELSKLIHAADSDSVRVSAIKDILDRAGYRPADRVEQASDIQITVSYVDTPQPWEAATARDRNGHELGDGRH